MGNEGDFSSVKLIFSDDLRDLMDQRGIGETYIRQVVAISESKEEKLVNRQTGRFVAHSRIGRITCWVEYKPEANGYRIFNVYKHRIEIEGER